MARATAARSAGRAPFACARGCGVSCGDHGGLLRPCHAILRGADRARGIEEPRLAIRQLVNEMIEFREAAALALGAAWFSKPRETQAEFIELFTGVLERGFVAAIVTKANVAGGVKIQYVGESVSGSRTTAPSSAASCVTIRTPV